MRDIADGHEGATEPEAPGGEAVSDQADGASSEGAGEGEAKPAAAAE